MAKRRFIYRGPYGSRHRAAVDVNIGEVFHGEEVELDEEAGVVRFMRPNREPVPVNEKVLFQLTGGGEWVEARTCEYRFATGTRCENDPADGSPYCFFHKRELERAAAKANIAENPVEPQNTDRE